MEAARLRLVAPENRDESRLAFFFCALSFCLSLYAVSHEARHEEREFYGRYGHGYGPYGIVPKRRALASRLFAADAGKPGCSAVNRSPIKL